MTEFNSKIKKNSRILKIFMFSICALFACAISSHAQSLVKGTVTDGIGEPLPGVSVVVKGTTNGTITDVNGKYSIQATAKDILSFSYVGMSDQEIKVAGQTTINVVMKDDVENNTADITIVSFLPNLSLKIPAKRTPTIEPTKAHPTYHPCCSASN